MPRLLSSYPLASYSLASDVIDTEKYYKSNHHKDQDIIDSMKQDTSLPKGSYYLYTKDIEQSLKIQIDFYTRARGYKALNIYTIDTNNQYKISYYNNPLDNIPYPKGTTFLTTPNTPIPTYHTDERVKIFLKGSKTYKDFILNLKQKIDSIQSHYEIERIRLEVGYGEEESEQLSKYFTLDEMVETNHKSLISSNKNFLLDSNNPQRLQSLKNLCKKILDKLQAHIYRQYGEHTTYKIHINSGVRCPELNKKIGGSNTSQHSYCEAADIAFMGNNNRKLLIELYEDIYNNKVDDLDKNIISQCIFELNNSYWIHIAISTERWKKAKNKIKPDFFTKPKGTKYYLYNGNNLNF